MFINNYTISDFFYLIKLVKGYFRNMQFFLLSKSNPLLSLYNSLSPSPTPIPFSPSACLFARTTPPPPSPESLVLSIRSSSRYFRQIHSYGSLNSNGKIFGVGMKHNEYKSYFKLKISEQWSLVK